MEQYELTDTQKASVLTHISSCIKMYGHNTSALEYMMQIDREYLREVDTSLDNAKAKIAQRSGDTSKIAQQTIPVILPKVETAVTYQSSVFLQGNPIFGVVSDPSNQDAALQIETIIENQQVRGGWVDELQQCFRDGFKYNLMGAEVAWEAETVSVKAADDSTQQSVVWAGNNLRKLDLYNTFYDPRVAPAKIAKDGEFGGYHELLSWVKLVRKLTGLGVPMDEILLLSKGTLTKDNLSKMADSQVTQGFGFRYFFPLFRNDGMGAEVPAHQWTGFLPARLDDSVPHGYLKDYLATQFQVTTIYVRIIPIEHDIGVADNEMPQIWKFVVVNGHTIVYASQMTEAHQMLPTVFSQPYNDGLGLQTKSLAENVSPFQWLTTALANSSIHARRKGLANQFLYDPNRIDPGLLNSDNPTSRIPVKASAFGSNVADAIHPIPWSDNLYQYNSADIQYYGQLADSVTGQNQARQGQFVKGNKTRTEYVDIMTNAQGRDHTVALSLEASFFYPIKEMIKSNIIQFQQVGSYYNRDERKQVDIEPETLRNAILEFKVSDGLVPSDKLISQEALMVAFQTMQSMPGVGAGYDVQGLFSYLLKTQGARIDAFEKSPEQMAYEEAVGAWQAACAQILEAAKMVSQFTMEDLTKLTESLPPQPTPEAFGFDPENAGAAEKPQQTILEQIASQS